MIDINATLIAQIVNFLILVVLLRAFAYKPVVEMLKSRQDKIADSLSKADADAAKAKQVLKEYEEQLSGARVKAQAIIDKASKTAQEEREASVLKTKHEIEQMKKAARDEIQREREQAAEQLKGEMIALSMAAASKIITKHLDASENEKLIAEFVEKLDKDKIGDLPC